MLSADDLLWVTGSRWFAPILARISRDDGARFAVLARELGVSRSMLSRTLGDLAERGWIERNPGHGHPLRPEYVLTEAGRPVGAWCEQVMAERARLGLEPSALPRWSLPLVWRLDGGWQRFSTLEAELQPITPRALSMTLKQLAANDLVARRLEAAAPLYGLTGDGRLLAGAMRAAPAFLSKRDRRRGGDRGMSRPLGPVRARGQRGGREI